MVEYFDNATEDFKKLVLFLESELSRVALSPEEISHLRKMLHEGVNELREAIECCDLLKVLTFADGSYSSRIKDVADWAQSRVTFIDVQFQDLEKKLESMRPSVKRHTPARPRATRCSSSTYSSKRMAGRKP